MKAHIAYLKYVLRHKWYVFLACRTLRVPLWQSVVHDWTKFLPQEWFPYVRKFYASEYRVGDIVDFQGIDGPHGDSRILEIASGSPCYDERTFRLQTLDGSQPKAFWTYGQNEIKENLTIGWAFDNAWNHHQAWNKHHWQYWFLIEDSGEETALEMPERYAREMLADWVGAGRAITGKLEVADWYDANKEKIRLHSKTRELVEKLIAQNYIIGDHGL